MKSFEINQGVEAENDSPMSLEEIAEKFYEMVKSRRHRRSSELIIRKVGDSEEKIDTTEEKIQHIEEIIKLLRQEEEKLIAEASNFGDLSVVLNRIGSFESPLNGIPGSGKFYEISEIKEDIDKVRSGELNTRYITRSLRLRDKVIDLLSEEEKKRNPKKYPFAKADDFMELFEILSRIDADHGCIHGSGKDYSISEIKREINKTRSKVRDGAETEESGTEHITRSLGLRDKVIDLLEKEKFEREQKVK